MSYAILVVLRHELDDLPLKLFVANPGVVERGATFNDAFRFGKSVKPTDGEMTAAQMVQDFSNSAPSF